LNNSVLAQNDGVACLQEFPFEDRAEREKMVYDGQFILTEAEPVFDGADALRFGRDIYVTLTHVSVSTDDLLRIVSTLCMIQAV